MFICNVAVYNVQYNLCLCNIIATFQNRWQLPLWGPIYGFQSLSTPKNKLQMHYVVVFFVPQYIAYWLCFIWTEFMSFWLVDFLLAALQLLSYFSERMISRETLRRNAVMQRRYGDQVWHPVIFRHITWSVSVGIYPTPIDLIKPLR